MKNQFTLPTLSTLAELSAPYMQYVTELAKRQAAYSKTASALVESSIRDSFLFKNANDVVNAGLDFVEKAQDTVVDAAKAEVHAHGDFARAAYASLVRNGFFPRSMLFSHQVEKAVATGVGIQEQAIESVTKAGKTALKPSKKVAQSSEKAKD